MRVAVRVVELAGPLKLPTTLHEYDGVRVYCSVRGQIKGYTTVWNSHKALWKKKFRYPDYFGSWLMLSNAFFSPLGTPPIDQGVIKGLLCAKANVQAENLDEPYSPIPEELPPLSASIVLATKDAPEKLACTLEQLVRHETRVPHEIIVVDQNPASGLTRPVVARFPQVCYVQQQPQSEEAYPLKAGILAARGEVVVITQAGIKIEEGWLDNLVAPFTNSQVGVVMGLVMPTEFEFPLPREDKPGLVSLVEQELQFDEFHRQYILSELGRLSDKAATAYRRAVFSDPAIGPFKKPGNNSALTEDSSHFYQLYRVLKAGWVGLFKPKALAYRQVKSVSEVELEKRRAQALKLVEATVREEKETDAKLKTSNKSLKICIVSTQYPPETNYGGIATMTYNMARFLARRGHRVTVISADHTGKGSWKMAEGVAIWRLSEPRPHSKLSEDLRRNWQVWRAIEKLRPDIVQLQEYEAEGFLATLLGRRRYAVVTGLIDPDTLTKIRDKASVNFRQNALTFMARQQARYSQALFCPSVRWGRRIQESARLKSRPIRQIITGLDLEQMNRLRQAEPTLKLNEPYLVFFGRLEERKGVRYLAQALPEVWEKFPDLKMVFIGFHDIYYMDGMPVKDYIEQKAGKYSANLIFTGYLPRETALPIVARAKLAILPSIWEPAANTCTEAIALGVPVVTTGDSGGNAEIVSGVDDEEVEPGSVPVGWLVPRQDARALAEAILTALTNEKAYAEVCERLPRRIRRFDAKLMAEELEELYQEVLAKNLSR